RISAIPTAAIPIRYGSARIPARTFSAAISPSTACCWTPSRTKCSILLVGERIWTLESSARSASQSCVLLKINCACCARCDSRRHSCPPTLAWGALLHDVGKPPTFRVAPDRIRFDGHVDVGVKMAEEICRRLRLSNHDTDQILALVKNHMKFAHAMQMSEATFKKFVRMPRFQEHLELHRIDCESSHGDLTTYRFTREKIASMPPEA